jgi:hypothetical protein
MLDVDRELATGSAVAVAAGVVAVAAVVSVSIAS